MEKRRIEVVSEVLLWNPQHGRRSRGRPMKTYLDQPRNYTMWKNEELTIAMNGREEWRMMIMISIYLKTQMVLYS